MYDNHVAPFNKQVKAADAEVQQQKELLMGVKMRKLNHFINKPFANAFCVVKYSQLKMYVIVIKYNYI